MGKPIKSEDMDVPMPFPLGGVDVSASYESQRPGTSAGGVNVRGYDGISLRSRGGSRPGIAEYIPFPVVDNKHSIQEINSVIGTGALSSALTANLSGTLLTGLVPLSPTSPCWALYTAGRWLFSGGFPGDVFQCVTTDGANPPNFFVTTLEADGVTPRIQRVTSAGAFPWGVLPLTLQNGVEGPTQTLHGQALPGAPWATANACVHQVYPTLGIYRYNVTDGAATTTNPWKTTAQLATAMGASTWQETGGARSVAIIGTKLAIAMINPVFLNPTWALGMAIVDTTSGVIVAVTGLDTITGTPTPGQAGRATWAFDPPWIIQDGTAFYFCIPGGQVRRITTAGAVSWTQTATNCGSGTSFAICGGVNNTPFIGIGGTTVTGGTFLSDAVALNPGGVALKTSDGTVISGGFSPMGNAIGSSVNLGDVGVPNHNFNTLVAYPNDHIAYAVATDDGGIDSDLDDLLAPVWSSGPIPQYGPIAGTTYAGASTTFYTAYTDYQRSIILVAVSNGVVKASYAGGWVTATVSTTGAVSLSSSAIVVRSAPAFGKLYFADGTKHVGAMVNGSTDSFIYYDPSDNAIHDWQPTAGGNLPVDGSGNGPRLIELWRGRIVLSGLLLDGQNWFMSAEGDPTNFDYSPTSTTATQAVAGNNSPLGLVGDTITGIVPYTDDVLVFGCDHQLWMLRGDPMAGGSLDVVSRELGMAWGRAWCVDPYGVLYFASNRAGVYKFIPGEQPIRISQQIDSLLIDISMDTVLMLLAWDERQQGIHVYVTPVFGSINTYHFFWEQRSGAWWVDNFANPKHNPLCVYSYYGKTAADRSVLMGSWDGYVRAWTPHFTLDDGYAIASYVWIGPLVTKELDEILCKDMQAVLSTQSGTVTFGIYTGLSAEAAFNSMPVVTGTWYVGRNYNTHVRTSGHALYLKISSTNAWALEALRLRIQTQGKIQRHAALV